MSRVDAVSRINGFVSGSAPRLALLVSISLGVAIPTFASPAAADAEPQRSSGARPDDSIGEIVVTAQRREEKLIDVPMAIAAVSGESLQAAGIQDIKSLQQAVPSLQISLVGGDPTISMRGIAGEVNQIAGEPSVAVSLDGVPFARQQYLLSAFLDVDRVEVLRGPQGTISGRNATGGALNIVSKRPTATPEGSISVTGGNYEAFGVSGVLSGPLSERVAGRIAVETMKDDGWLRNTLTGIKFGDTDRMAVRGSLLFTPTDSFSLYVSAEHAKNDVNGPAFLSLGAQSPYPIVNPPGLPTVVSDPENLTFQMGSSDDFQDMKISAATVEANWTINETVSMRSVTGYRKFKMDWLYEAQRLPIPFSPLTEPFDQDQISQELTFTGSAGDNFDWLVGGLYLKDDADLVTSVVYVAGPLAGLVNLSFHDVQELRSTAGYAQVRWRFAPGWQLTAGGRYTRDKKDWVEEVSFPAFAPPAITAPANESWSDFTPRIALDYKPSDNITAYASFAEGFKAGGFSNGAAVGGAPDPFDPETVENFEVGLKTRWLDGRFGANLTLFKADYKDLQQSIFNAPATRIENATTAEIQGAELELAARPTDRVSLGLSATFLDSEYGEYASFNTGRPDLPIAGTGGFRFDSLGRTINTGNQLTRAPKVSANANASVDVPLGGSGSLNLRADYAYQSKVYFTPYNEDIVSQDAYGVLNLRATFTSANGRWNASVFGNNIADERYFNHKVPLGNTVLYFIPGYPPVLGPGTDGLAFGGTVAGVLGAPRTYGLTLGYRF